MNSLTGLYQLILPECTWRLSTKEKLIYLTFDDGPTSEVTEFVLDQLHRYSGKGTFFILGRNASVHRTLLEQIAGEGHTIGNHTMEHEKGWQTNDDIYQESVITCQSYCNSNLFRPPYGRIKKTQLDYLSIQYRIIMWDVLSMDWVLSETGETVAGRVLKMALPGSIVVMHDSVKAFQRLRIALPKILCHFSERGYSFAALPKDGLDRYTYAHISA